MGVLNLKDVSQVPGYAPLKTPFAKLYVYKKGTDVPCLIFADSNLTTSRASPLVADGEGRFEQCYLVDGDYRIEVLDRFDRKLVSQESVSVSSAPVRGVIKGFATVADVLLDETLTYTQEPGGFTVSPGDLVEVRDLSRCYRVMSSTEGDVHLVTAGGIVLQVADTSDIDLACLGAPRDGDASAQLQKALDIWVARLQGGLPAYLRIRGEYRFDTPVSAVFTKNVWKGGAIDMTGGRLHSQVAAGEGAAFSVRSMKTVRKLDLINFNLHGSTQEDVLLEIDGGDGHSIDSLYGWNLVRPKLEAFWKVGLRIINNAFEATIDDPYFACGSTADGTFCMLCEDNQNGATSGNVSSIVLRGGVMRGGENNLRCDDNADIRCYGTTFLLAGKAAIVENNMTGGCYKGIHIENPWVNGGGTNMAGMSVLNKANLSDIYVLGNNGHVNTGVNFFAVQADCRIDNVIISADLDHAICITNGTDNGARVLLTGIRRDKVKFLSPAGEKIVSFPDRQSVKSFTASATSPVPLDVNRNNIFDVTCDSDVSFSQPTGMITGDSITVILMQDATGGRGVTWPGNFRSTQPFGQAPGTHTIWEFIYSGGLWLQANGTGA